MAQRVESGICEMASGYTTNASPAPVTFKTKPMTFMKDTKIIYKEIKASENLTIIKTKLKVKCLQIILKLTFKSRFS